MGRAWGRLRRPEYTGENRCAPCTAVNVVIAVVVSAAITAVLTPLAGGLAFGASAVAIYLRGYLVPGTPTITARYFPDRLLALFGKEARRPAADDATDPLEALGAVERDESGTHKLSPAFRRAWNERVADLRDAERGTELVADLFGVEPSAVSAFGDDAYLVDDERLVQWPSEAARLADLAAGQPLPTGDPEWTELDGDARAETLALLRSLRRDCPACGGRVSRTEHRVDSCCQPARTVVTAACEECGARLAEVETDERGSEQHI